MNICMVGYGMMGVWHSEALRQTDAVLHTVVGRRPEAVRQLVGFGGDAIGKLHIFDGLAPAMRTIRIVKDPACKGCQGQSARS